MSKVCDIDSSQVKRLLQNLNQEKRKEAMFKALSKGGQFLVEETKRELVKKLPKATEGKRYKKPMVEGVKMKKDKYDNEVLVHILGDFRLKFFELGTDERYIKKKVEYKRNGKVKFRKENDTQKGYRGSINPPMKFFENAIKNEADVINEIDKNLIQNINKLLK